MSSRKGRERPCMEGRKQQACATVCAPVATSYTRTVLSTLPDTICTTPRDIKAHVTHVTTVCALQASAHMLPSPRPTHALSCPHSQTRYDSLCYRSSPTSPHPCVLQASAYMYTLLSPRPTHALSYVLTVLSKSWIWTEVDGSAQKVGKVENTYHCQPVNQRLPASACRKANGRTHPLIFVWRTVDLRSK